MNRSQTGDKGMKTKMLIMTLLGCLIWQQGALSQTDTNATNPATADQAASASQPAANTDSNQVTGAATDNSAAAPAAGTAEATPAATTAEASATTNAVDTNTVDTAGTTNSTEAAT